MAPRQNKAGSALTADKLSWQWAETTEPENVTTDHVHQAYRLTLKPCNHATNRRNCRGNPRCLFGIGERQWMVDILDSYWYSGPHPDDARRKKGERCGLKNFGATCYVNTLLQVWYNNPPLRDAVYRYRDPLLNGVNTICESDYCPQSVCGQLQLIFAMMEKSVRKHVDPLSLINVLGLDTMQQQDAQEFSKLFMSLLGNTLSQQADQVVRNVVRDEFCGLYKYTTTCKTCGFTSERKAEFYELDLNVRGNKDLQSCLREFLKEEKLEGENQYACQQCKEKRDATRRIILTRLPRTLNCQLLRFVYDRSSQQKKKINTCIQFPEELDMSPYIKGSPSGELAYQLSAVLVHRGTTPYSGHYIAHIRHRGQGEVKAETEKDVWYKYNDELVEKMKGSSLHLGAEEELMDTPKQNGADAGEPSPKKLRLSRGMHTSQNAYMLVYRSCQNQGAAAREPLQDGVLSLPEHVLRAVDKDNQQFQLWCYQEKIKKEEAILRGRTKQLSIQQTYNRLLTPTQRHLVVKDISEPKAMVAELPVKNGESSCDPLAVIDRAEPLVAVEGTKHVPLVVVDGTKSEAPIVRIEPELSALGRTDPQPLSGINGTKLELSKGPESKPPASIAKTEPLVAVTETKMEFLSTDWLTSYFTDPDSCKSVDNTPFLCKHGRLDVDQVAQMKLINHTVTEEFYCRYGGGPRIPSDLLCRQCVTSRCKKIRLKWRLTADQQLINQLLKQPVSREEVGYWVGKRSIRNWKSMALRLITEEKSDTSSSPSDDVIEDDDVIDNVTFNADLLCEDHGELTVEENSRRVVCKTLWSLYKFYFPDAPELNTQTSVCTQCQLQAAMLADERDKQRHLALQCRTLLPDLYANRKRPSHDVIITGNVIKVDDVTKVSTSQNNPVTNDRTSVGKVTSADGVTSEEKIETYFVMSHDCLEEWRKFIRSQGRITVPCLAGNGMFICHHNKLSASLNVFLHTAIHNSPRAVLLYDGEWIILSSLFPSITSHSICLSVRQSGSGSAKFYSVDPDVCPDCRTEQNPVTSANTFSNALIYIHRPPNDSPADDDQDPTDQSESSIQVATNQKSVYDQPIRRSHRYRRSRDDIELRVDSTDSIKDLKIKLMNRIQIAPFDQHLYACGEELCDESWTLADCALTPNCVLQLKVDEPDDRNNVYWPQDAQTLSSCPEEGFKGTSLLGSSSQ